MGAQGAPGPRPSVGISGASGALPETPGTQHEPNQKTYEPNRIDYPIEQWLLATIVCLSLDRGVARNLFWGLGGRARQNKAGVRGMGGGSHPPWKDSQN